MYKLNLNCIDQYDEHIRGEGLSLCRDKIKYNQTPALINVYWLGNLPIFFSVAYWLSFVLLNV